MKLFVLLNVFILLIHLVVVQDDCEPQDIQPLDCTGHSPTIKVGVMLYRDINEDFHSHFLKNITIVKSYSIFNELNICLDLHFSYDNRDHVTAYNLTVDYLLESNDFDIMVGPSTSPQSEIVSGAIDYYIKTTCNSSETVKVIPDVTFHSTSAIFDDRKQFPYLFKSYHNNKGQAQAWTMLMMHFQWKRCALISTLDTYGVTSASEFANNARKYDIDVFQLYYPENSDEDIENILTSIKSQNYTIIFVTTNELQNKKILTKAKSFNMDTKEYVWIFTETNARWVYYDCSWIHSTRYCEDDYSDSNNKCNFKSDCYYRRNDTLPNHKNNEDKAHCNFGALSLFASPNPGHGPKWIDFMDMFREYTCNNDIDPYYLKGNYLAEYLIDALEGVAKAFKDGSKCHISCDSVTDLNNECRQSLSGYYQGVTGWLDLNQPRNVSFDIVNIRHEVLDDNNTVGRFYTIGTWSNTSIYEQDIWKQNKDEECTGTDDPFWCNMEYYGYYSGCKNNDIKSILKVHESCNNTLTGCDYTDKCINAFKKSFKTPSEDDVKEVECRCIDVNYNKNSSVCNQEIQVLLMRSKAMFHGSFNVPGDGSEIPFRYPTWHDPIASVLSFVVFLFLYIITLSIFAILKYQRTPIIIHSTATFLITICVGMCIITFSILFWIGKPTEFTCNIKAWLGFIGYSLVLFPYIAKNWRIWRVFEPRKKTRNSVMKNSEFFRYIGIFISIVFIILIVFASLKDQRLRGKVNYDINDITKRDTDAYCSGGFIFLLLLGIYLLSMTVLNAVIAFQIRKFDTGFKETYYINLIACFSLVIVIVGCLLLLVLKGQAQIIGVTVCILFFVTINFLLLVVPKLFIMFIKKEENVTPPEFNLTVKTMNNNEEPQNDYYNKLKELKRNK